MSASIHRIHRGAAGLFLVILVGGLLWRLATPLPAHAAAGVAAPVAQADGEGWPGDKVVIEFHPCTVFLPYPEQDGKTVVCGTMRAPVDYAKPDGKQLEIAFVKLLSTSLSPAAEPVVYLEGGPGGSALSRVKLWADTFATLRQTHDVILFDQRGTTYSTPISCTPVMVAMASQADSDPELADILTQLVQADADAPIPAAILATTYGTCAEFYAGEGYDVTQFNTQNNARDLMNLVHALGYEGVNLYGISYGTRLALVAMRDWPAHIRSVVLDSSYPTQINNYETVTVLYEEQLQQIFAECAADAACAAAYPDLPARLHNLLEEDLSFEAADGESLTASEILAALPDEINSNPGLANWLPRIITAMEDGEIVDLEALSDQMQETASPGAETLTDQMIMTVQEYLDQVNAVGQVVSTMTYTNTPGYQFMDQFMAAGQALDEETRMRFAIELWGAMVFGGDPLRTTFGELIDEFLEPAEAAPLRAALDQLTDGDLQVAMNAQREAIVGESAEDGMNAAFECAEEMPFNDLEAIDAALAAQEFPELGEGQALVSAQTAAKCKFWPQAKITAAFKAPVESAVPTLVLSGLYDTQTPPSWNAAAAAGLQDAFLLEFPMAGHGVMLFSKCANDIVQAFVNRPDVQPLATCIDLLGPSFVGPEEELPTLAAPGAEDEVDAAIFVGQIPATDGSSAQRVALYLFADGTAGMTGTYEDGSDLPLSHGLWVLDDDGALTVTMLGTEETEFSEPAELKFIVDGDTLTLDGEPWGIKEDPQFSLVQSEEELAGVVSEQLDSDAIQSAILDALGEEKTPATAKSFKFDNDPPFTADMGCYHLKNPGGQEVTVLLKGDSGASFTVKVPANGEVEQCLWPGNYSYDFRRSGDATRWGEIRVESGANQEWVVGD